MTTIVHLTPAMFEVKERTLVEDGELRASVFRYDSGVAGLRLSNRAGELVLLPFQGQQIWSATFGGRNLTMKSMFDQPYPTQNYLQTYGGFLIHCGFTAMGVPAAEDSHPLHGELPNAPYAGAWLSTGTDERGEFISLGGEYEHIVAFSTHYVASPEVRLYAGESGCRITMAVTNRKQTAMEYMYMAHVNFRPVDNGRLVYSAPSDTDHVRVRKSIPSHVKPGPDYLNFLATLEAAPARHEVLEPGLAFDPEVVFYIDYLADDAGWARTMQVHPDGTADFIRHRPEQLDKGVRWISRTPDQDALGMVLPATAEPEGYSAEKAKGNVKVLDPGAAFFCAMEIGVLPADQAAAEAEEIRQIAPE
ncbi:MAG: DUF4432 family protein [Caldilineaceae bacterium]|nr:DUF4432 family protein [Caldilineaceae bacterium]